VNGIDPRLRARRIDVARTEGRKRLRRVAILGGVLVVVLLVVGATRPPLLDVDRIDVRGVDGARAEAATSASGLALGDHLLWADLGAAAAGIEALPWVAEASVERDLPGTVVLQVEAREPVAIAGSGPAAVLVDADGRAIAGIDDPVLGGTQVDDLPVLAVGPAPLGERLGDDGRAMAKVVAGLPVELAEQVDEVAPDGEAIVVVLDDGIEVRWGGPQQTSAKAAAALVILQEADRATIATIDVTVPRATTVTRQTGAR
jgi:cell division protein FtsQ